MSDTPYSSNWQNDLTISGIEALEKKLKEANARIGDNPKVKQAYQDALNSVSKTREVISCFVGTYNKEYRREDEGTAP